MFFLSSYCEGGTRSIHIIHIPATKIGSYKKRRGVSQPRESSYELWITIAFFLSQNMWLFGSWSLWDLGRKTEVRRALARTCVTGLGENSKLRDSQKWTGYVWALWLLTILMAEHGWTTNKTPEFLDLCLIRRLKVCCLAIKLLKLVQTQYTQCRSMPNGRQCALLSTGCIQWFVGHPTFWFFFGGGPVFDRSRASVMALQQLKTWMYGRWRSVLTFT